MKRLKYVLAAAAPLLGLIAFNGAAHASTSATRLFGNDRIATAIAVSRDSYPTTGSASAAVLANAAGFADALAGAPLAVGKNGPLLLTPADSLPQAVGQELQRAVPSGSTIYLLGGGFALSDNIASQVQALGFQTVRYAGPNRFATATIIADQGLGNPSTVIEATGMDFPDALAGAAAAPTAKAAILLTNGSQQPQETAAYLSAHSGDTRFALGGSAASADPGATAIVGTDRIQTAVLVAQKFFGTPSSVGVASGFVFPDALSGGTHIGRLGGPILLSAKPGLSTASWNYISANASSITKAFIYGGGFALADQVTSDVNSALSGTRPPTTTTTTTGSQHFTTFGPGQYHVGSDIPAGTYRTRSDSSGCYWERESGFSGQPDDVIANNFSNFHQVVAIASTDAGFKTSNCATWTSDLSAITQSPTAAFGSGVWIVNTDIAPGTWTAAGGSKCYWERDSSFSSDANSVIANDFGTANPTVTIAPSDVGFRTEGCGTWTKTG